MFEGVLFGFFAFVLGEAFELSISPTLPLKLSLQFGFDEQRTGLFFFNYTVIVALVTLSLLFVPHKTSKVLFILSGSFIIVVGALLTGPSKLLSLPNQTKIMKVGLWIAGVGRALMGSFSSSYMEKHGIVAFPEQEQQLSERIGMLINLGQAVGVMIIQITVSCVCRLMNFSRAL